MKQVVLVELDALLDTRMGTLLQLDRDYAERIMADGSYFTRRSDTFSSEHFSAEEYKARYQWRNVDTLKHSVRTRVGQRVKELVQELETMAINTPFVERVAVELNTYPYKLSSELKEAFRESIAYFVGPTAELKLVHYKPEALTPQNIQNQGWTGLILYDFDHWFSLHGQALTVDKIQDVVFIVPALFVKEPKPEDRLMGDQPDTMAFSVGEGSLVEFLTLVYTDPLDFSADIHPAA